VILEEDPAHLYSTTDRLDPQNDTIDIFSCLCTCLCSNHICRGSTQRPIASHALDVCQFGTLGGSVNRYARVRATGFSLASQASTWRRVSFTCHSFLAWCSGLLLVLASRTAIPPTRSIGVYLDLSDSSYRFPGSHTLSHQMHARLPCAPHIAFRPTTAAAAACDRATAATRLLVSYSTSSPFRQPATRTKGTSPSQASLLLLPQTQLLTPTLPTPPSHHHHTNHTQTRPSSSSSTTRWKTRQTSDPYSKSSKLSALKSRAAYKLLEINDKHKLFKPGQSVVDLGYAPGSWSQVAKNRVGESGRVVGIDVIPALPPRGVSALQGDFLSEGVQGLVREFVREWKSGEGEDGVLERVRGGAGGEGVVDVDVEVNGAEEEGGRQEEVDSIAAAQDGETTTATTKAKPSKSKRNGNSQTAALDLQQGRVVDVVLSDMCAPFPGLEFGSWSNSVNRPYRRMMNTSGNPFRDHAGSIVSLIELSRLSFHSNLPIPSTISPTLPAKSSELD